MYVGARVVACLLIHVATWLHGSYHIISLIKLVTDLASYTASSYVICRAPKGPLSNTDVDTWK